MLKILQARLQQYMNWELQMYKLGFEEARNQRWNCQHLLAYGESKGVPENIYFYFIDCAKFFDYVNHNKLWENS